MAQYKLAHKGSDFEPNILTGNGVQELEEELKLNELCCTAKYKCLKDSLQDFLKISNLTLEPSLKYTQLSNQLCLRKNPGHPPTSWRKSRLLRSIWGNSYVRPVWLAFLIYFGAKFSVITLAHIRRDISMKYLAQSLSLSNSITDRCILPSNQSQVPHIALEIYRLNRLNYLLSLMGDPFISIVAGPNLCYLLLSLDVIGFYLIGFVMIHYNELRADYLAFIFQPVVARRRMRFVLNNIALGILDSIENCEIEMIEKQDGEDEKLNQNKDGLDNVFKRKSNERKRRIKFVQLLLRVSQNHLAMPANLTAEWLIKLATNTLFFVKNYRKFNLIYWYSTMVLFFTQECIHRVNYRKTLLKCHQWNLNSRPSPWLYNSPVNHLTTDKTTQPTDYNSSPKNHTNTELLKLIFFVEARQLIFSLSGLALVELFLVINFTSFAIVPTIYSLFWGPLVDKMHWMHQIIGQMTECLNILQSLKSSQVQPEIEIQNTQLLEKLTTGYLNFSLLITQCKYFKRLANTVLVQVFVVFGLMLLATYITSVYMDFKQLISIWITVGTTYFTVFINCYLIACSFMSIRAKKMIHLILKLMALSTNGPSSLLPIRALWRRQLTIDGDLSKFFAFTILGYEISANKIVTFNFYLLGLFIIQCRNRIA